MGVMEIKRKANVGERIKIVDAKSNLDYGNGDVFEVRGVIGEGNVMFRDNIGALNGAALSEYVVLEKTDIVRVGYVRYRAVERKADVGDRVVVTKGDYEVGKIGEVTRAGEFYDGSIDVRFEDGTTVFIDCDYEAYFVLEPLESTRQPEPAAAPSVPDLAAIKRQLDEQGVQIAGLTDAVGKLTLQLKVAREEGVGTLIGDVSKPRVTPQEAALIDSEICGRAAVVERAKTDVAKLERTPRDVYGTHPHFWPEVKGKRISWTPIQSVTYVVNRGKRTIVALIRSLHSGNVYAKGIAKCAPGDVFNTHIGRAIALRRALGLSVPSEYTNAPQPSEVRVGDIVANWQGRSLRVRADGEADGLSLGYVIHNGYRVIDDSREGEDEGVDAE